MLKTRAERLKEMGRRDVPHDEEKRELKRFIAGLRKDRWKKHQVDAAWAGWEWAFDTGFDQECDSDAAGDLADMFVSEEPKKWKPHGGKGGCADDVYTGICAARRLQETPDPDARAESVAEIKAATVPTEAP